MRKVVKANDSVDILKIYQEHLLGNYQQITIDMSDFDEDFDIDVKSAVKLQDIAREKGMDIEFINQNGKFKNFKKES